MRPDPTEFIEDLWARAGTCPGNLVVEFVLDVGQKWENRLFAGQVKNVLE